jgi:hypothetical protein
MSRRSTIALVSGLLALVAAFYVFIVSAGHLAAWPVWTTFYDAQAEGFRAGHLYLTLPRGAKHWDYSSYQGHWYLYWGLAPAFALAVVKTVGRIGTAVGDQVLTFDFVAGRLVAGTLLVLALARRRTPRPPPYAVALALAVFGLAAPTPFLLARGAIYEAAIAAGTCFLTFGLWAALRGVFAAPDAPSAPWLAGASVAFGLAAASRISLYPAVAAIVAITIVARARLDGGAPRAWLRAAAFTGTPFGLVTAAHLLVNKLRFGAWTEFGAAYQLGIKLKTGGRFLVPNLFLYLFQPADLTCRFPFVLAKWDRSRPFAPAWLPWPADYRTTEPMMGVLTASPFVVVGIVSLGIALWRARRGQDGSPAADPAAAAERLRWRWVYAALAAGVVVGGAPVLFMFSTSLRYEADFLTAALPLAILGGWRLLAAPTGRRGRAAAATVYVTLAAATIATGMLLGFTGYFNQFEHNNPALMKGLQAHLSLCGEERR